MRKYSLLVIFFLLFPMYFMAIASSPGSEKEPVDTLLIDLPDRHKMPPARFPHDRHTEALVGRGCETCHAKDGGRFAFDFKTAGSLDYEAAMALYHADCAGCHKEMEANDKSSGPGVGKCRECHVEQRAPESAWKPLPFDRSLHFRHVGSKSITFKPEIYEQNCGACHHVYDKKLKQTVYRKGEEGSCRYCHKEIKTEEARSNRDAVHTACVNCHVRLSAAGKEAGPTDCAGCHAEKRQSGIEKVKNVPRLKTRQPDAVLMAGWLDAAGKKGELPAQLTQPVAFDHIGHEAAVGSCRECHHASLDPCAKCHTLRGEKEGGFVPLEAAMHRENSPIACIGCHSMVMRKPDCAGCHAQMAEKPFGSRECRQCHGVDPETLKPLPVDNGRRGEIARAAVEGRKQKSEMIPGEQIPEKLVIDIMAEEYRGSEFPHRKIIRALAERTKDSRLAAVFHQKPETLCMGCHHNSPASLKPPKCISCHKLEGPRNTDDRPGLKGAYHGQCIGCHTRMNIEKPAGTDCTACHKKSNGSKISDQVNHKG